MPRQNIHDPIFEAEISEWEHAREPFSSERIFDLCKEIPREDILGRSELVGRILKRLNSDDCPAALGIYGGWGTGKTSLLNLLKLINAEKFGKHLQIERIDAWKYEGTGNLFIPVITLLKKLAGNEINKDPEYWKKRAKHILTVTTLASVNIVGKKLFDVDTKTIEQYYSETADNSMLYKWEKLTNEIDETEAAFQEIVKLATDNLFPASSKITNGRIVFCIDNLDRCSPENVVSLLESIKNFVGVKNCTWVFAMDSSVVASYINKKYAGTSMDGYSYLDKIIPEQFHISLTPSRDGDQIIHLINDATCGIIIERAEDLPQIPKILVPRRLIKSARKLMEFENKAGIDDNIIFALILLYNSWPDFYERLSSPDEKHVAAVLAHFFKNSTESTWSGITPLPLDEKFTQDQELVCFLRLTLHLNQEGSSSAIQDTTIALDELREIGLP